MAEYIVPQLDNLQKDLLWVEIKAWNFDRQSGYARGNSISTGSLLGSWKLLAPSEINETISHDWSEYESVGSRIAEKTGEIKKGIAEIKAGANSVSNIKTINGGANVSTAKKLINGMAGSSVPKYKVDTSLVYKGSQRREYSLTFQFSVTKTATESDVFEPVRKLEELSCAEMVEGTLIDIKFPAIFSVQSNPGDLIKIQYAALTAVQPTWKGPYKNGYPTSCELQLTFIDISPLYRKSFTQGGIIKTS